RRPDLPACSPLSSATIASVGCAALSASTISFSERRSHSVTRSVATRLESASCARNAAARSSAPASDAILRARLSSSRAAISGAEVEHHRGALGVAELGRAVEHRGVDQLALHGLEAKLLGEEVAGALGDEVDAPRAATAGATDGSVGQHPA